MRNKRLIGIFSITCCFVLLTILLRNINVNSSKDKIVSEEINSSETVDIEEEENILEQIKSSEEEEWEYIQEESKYDIDATKDGHVYNLDDIDEIKYGGVTYFIHEAGYIANREDIPYVIEDYKDECMNGYEQGELYIDYATEERGEQIIWYAVVDVINYSDNIIHADASKIGIAITREDGELINDATEAFYVDANLDTESFVYIVEVSPGERKTLILMWNCMHSYDEFYKNNSCTDEEVIDVYVTLSPIMGDSNVFFGENIYDNDSKMYIKFENGSFNELRERYKVAE